MNLMVDQLKVQELQKSNLNVHELTINHSIVHDFDLHTNGSKRSIKVHELYELFSQLMCTSTHPYVSELLKCPNPNWSDHLK